MLATCAFEMYKFKNNQECIEMRKGGQEKEWRIFERNDKTKKTKKDLRELL